MGVADLVDAFNGAAGPDLVCSKATLGYERAHDLEWQVLTFSGTWADGSAFSVVEKLRGGADPLLGARDAAKNLLAKKELPHEPVLALPAPAADPAPADPAGEPGDGATG